MLKNNKILEKKKNQELKERISSSILDDVVKEKIKPSDDGLYRIVDMLLNDDYKRRKTILSSNAQVSKITTIDVISQLYDIPFLKHWVSAYAQWRTSGDGGKGRNDIVDITKFNFQNMESQRNELLDIIRSRR